MDPWLHHVSRSLTVRHIASPIVDIDCDPREPVGEVVQRVRDHLRAVRTTPELPPSRRATVLFKREGDAVRFAVLDWCLSDSIWLDEWREDPVSIFAREASLDSVIDGSASFETSLDRFARLNPDLTRSGRASSAGEWRAVEPDQHLLMLDRGRVAGALREDHFKTVPVRVAILALLLELEEAVVERAYDEPGAALACLPAERLEMARKRADASKLSVFDALYFADKMTIARKMKWGWAGVSQRDAKSIATRLEGVRNWCAHTGADSPTIFLDDLLFAIESARSLQMAMQRLS